MHSLHACLRELVRQTSIKAWSERMVVETNLDTWDGAAEAAGVQGLSIYFLLTSPRSPPSRLWFKDECLGALGARAGGGDSPAAGTARVCLCRNSVLIERFACFQELRFYNINAHVHLYTTYTQISILRVFQ